MNTPDNLQNARYYFSDKIIRKMKTFDPANTVIMEAPSGYGKTTAMRNYINNNTVEKEDVYWFTAIEEEAPAMLYRRFCRELEKIDPDTGKQLIRIDFPNTFTIGEVCETLQLINCKRKTKLIIDDFHHLFKILPISFIKSLINTGNSNFQTIILTQMLRNEFKSYVYNSEAVYIGPADLQWNAEDIQKYFILSDAIITFREAQEVEMITDGWIVAVRLQLSSFIENATFSGEAVSQMMEHLIWDKMPPEQQDFFLRASVYEACTIDRLGKLLNWDKRPEYAASSLSIPFIRYIPDQQLCVPHVLLLDLVRKKRIERGKEFNDECVRKAGDVSREAGEFTEAIFFYDQIKDYRSILSMDLSHLTCAEIGDKTFNEIALDISQNCPQELKEKCLHSMLCVAWSIRFTNNFEEFTKLMNELKHSLPETGYLKAEWLLLSAYLHYPDTKRMLQCVKEAAEIFEGKASRIILPESPWAFYEFIQISTFHTKPGSAEEEAEFLESFIKFYTRLTGGHGTGADVLFRAELTFFKGETEQAEIYAHKAAYLSEKTGQKIIHIGAVRLLAVIALLKSDLPGWQKIVDNFEQASLGSTQNTSIFRKMLDIVSASLLAQLREYERIPEWLKTNDFIKSDLPYAIYVKAVEIHSYYLMGKGEYAQLIGFLLSVFEEVQNKDTVNDEYRPENKYSPFIIHFYCFTIAVGFSFLGNTAKSLEYIELAAQQSLPDNMIHCFAGFSRLLNNLSDNFIDKNYPKFISRFKEYKERYFTGWFTLYNAITQNDLPGALTEREQEVAVLAAEGLRNIEIARKLYLSEHTVRAHLRSVYQKLEIDRRAKLSKLLN